MIPFFSRLDSGLLGCCCIGTAYGLTDLDYHGVDVLLAVKFGRIDIVPIPTCEASRKFKVEKVRGKEVRKWEGNG